MKDNKIYILDMPKLDQALQEFVNANAGTTINREDNDNEIKLELTDGTRRGILHIYKKDGGNVSHYEQGDWVAIAESCWSYLFVNYGMQIRTSVLPTIHGVERVDFDAFIDCFRDTNNYTITDKPLPPGAEASIVITDKCGASVHLNYYTKKKSVLIQGAATRLLITIVSECVNTIPQANSNLLDTILPPDRNGTLPIDSDINNHITNMAPIAGSKIEKLINTSLTLINSGLMVDDFSCFSASILRALDAIINERIKQVAAAVVSYGDYFVGDPAGGYKMRADNNPFAANPEIADLLSEAYTYYHNHRHPIAHTDHQNVETTRILCYEEALLEIRDALQLINNICETW